MNSNELIDVFRGMMNLAIQISGPMLLICMLVGVLIAILQAVTQIHEQSIGFVIKLIVVALYLSLAGSWILTSMHDFMAELFQLMV